MHWPAQVVPHLARGVLRRRYAEQLGDRGPESSVGDPLGRRGEQTQDAEQGRHPRLAELQGGALSLRSGKCGILDSRRREVRRPGCLGRLR